LKTFVQSLLNYTRQYETPYQVISSDYNEIEKVINTINNDFDKKPIISLLKSYITYKNCIHMYAFGFHTDIIKDCKQIIIPDNIINSSNYMIDINNFLITNKIRFACVPHF